LDIKSKKIITVNEELVKNKIGKVVRETVEETLNKLLDAEADELCKAEKYECTKKRMGTIAGYYERNLETKSGKVKLKVPKLRKLPFKSAIIERYKKRECSVEEALIEMYLYLDGIVLKRTWSKQVI
jgi:putative transposase